MSLTYRFNNPLFEHILPRDSYASICVDLQIFRSFYIKLINVRIFLSNSDQTKWQNSIKPTLLYRTVAVRKPLRPNDKTFKKGRLVATELSTNLGPKA